MKEQDMLQLVLENERVRILKVQIKPGEKTIKHSHPDHVICAMNDQKLKITNSDGEESELDLNFSQVLYSGPTTHVVENVGKTEAIAIVIELKKLVV